MGSPSLWAGEDASSRRVVAQSRIVQPPARAGGGPEPGGTAGTEQAVCSATWAEPGAIPAACNTATATQNPSLICDLHHSSWQRHILNPLVLMGTIFSILLVTMILMAFCVYKPIRRR